MGLFEKYAESIAIKDLNTQSYNECEQLYSNGNYEKALESCLRYSINTDDARIWTMIGNMYRFGYGCTANQEEAFTWLSKAAMARVPEAEYQLWQMYRDGDGVAKDPSEALMWLTKAANHKYGDAALDLADLYTGRTGKCRSGEGGSVLQDCSQCRSSPGGVFSWNLLLFKMQSQRLLLLPGHQMV